MSISNLPKLGFGLMRLPAAGDAFDMPQLCEMVDAYMEHGSNYFDTAYVYHGGKSEIAAKEALVNRYPRDSFYLADKLPIWEIKSKDDRDRIFNIQLERAGVEYFDFYLLHSIEDTSYGRYIKYDCFEWGKQKKLEGKIKHFGFSFHGSPEMLDKILTHHPELEFVQIQLNYADWNSPVIQSGAQYEVARKHNAVVIAMEPVKGGMLANTTPEIAKLMTDVHPGRSVASWAIRFTASLEGVAVVLSGMSNMEQMLDNINTIENFEPITDLERGIMDKVTAAMATSPVIPCTDCRYCVDGCPVNIPINGVFKAVNELRLYGEHDRPYFFYRNMSGGRAKDCTGCKKCESVCPQHLEIIRHLKEASAKLDSRIET
ncbi:MAG: aldo/keto reductase [Oscillospiraceae bacterium]|nr:aldo/keto reductase [Oscillospiraceae bacterium]